MRHADLVCSLPCSDLFPGGLFIQNSARNAGVALWNTEIIGLLKLRNSARRNQLLPTLLDLCLYNIYFGCVDCCVRVNGGVYDRKKDKSADKDLAKLFLDWFHGPASNDDVAAIPYHEISQPFEH